MISTSLTCYLNLQYSHYQICWKSLYFGGVNFETELVGTEGACVSIEILKTLLNCDKCSN